MFQLIFKVFEQQQPAKNASLAPTANEVEWERETEWEEEKRSQFQPHPKIWWQMPADK